MWGNIGRYGHAGVSYAYPYCSTGGTGYAYGIWYARTENAASNFDLIANLADVKRGDVVVLDKGRYAGDEAGHVAFADEDYDGSGYLWLVGQNQENASAEYGHVATRDRISVAKFLGAFRLKAWGQPTPPIPEQTKKKRFPFFLYTNRLNRIRSGYAQF